MSDVARWKWNAGKAVHDPQRESELLDRLISQARDAGLDEDIARRFFQAQMQAAKSIQHAEFAEWRDNNQQKFDNVPDLQTELRPKISELSRRLIEELALLQPVLATPQLQATIKDSHFDPDKPVDWDVWTQAVAPLLANLPKAD